MQMESLSLLPFPIIVIQIISLFQPTNQITTTYPPTQIFTWADQGLISPIIIIPDHPISPTSIPLPPHHLIPLTTTLKCKPPKGSPLNCCRILLPEQPPKGSLQIYKSILVSIGPYIFMCMYFYIYVYLIAYFHISFWRDL